MREILFRGKRIDNGEWVYGVAFPHDNAGAVTMFFQHPLDGSLEGREVDPSTVGQYTGLTDKGGKKIFEGDIVKAYSSYFNGECYREHEVIKPVAYDCGGFFLGSRDDDSEGWLGDWCISCDDTQDFIEVIGNIHDNPELLEARE